AFTQKADGAARVRASGNLGGVAGWFEYDVDIASDGWYALVLNGNGWEAEFFIDPKGDDPARAAYYQANSAGLDSGLDKVGNFWLTRGRHTIRLQHQYWTGFQGITGLSLQPAGDESVARTARATLLSRRASFRVGECPDLEIAYGPRRTPGVLPVHWLNVESPTLRTSTVSLPATPTPQKMRVPVPCSAEGNFQYYFNGGPDKIGNRDVQPISYEVIDTRRAPQPGGELKKELVFDVDTTATAPDYAAGETRVVRKPFGAYRESDDRGWLDYLHSRVKLGEPSWFAYVLKGVAKQQPYLVEVDYPDDADRTFAISLRESDPLSYPVTGGVDSGGEFALTQRMQTQSLVFWPRASDPRIAFITARNGKTAAAARIRVYRITGPLPALVEAPTGRRYVNWYEEGSNFFSMYGAPGQTPAGSRAALERWAQALAYMGGDTLWPTVAIYSFALYPSVYHKSFSRVWEHDVLRQTLLIAEKHRLKVVPELHPRADELSWPYANGPDPKANRLVSRNGATHDDLPPFYNPLLPANQDWYVDMIGELVDRYGDSPALDGVSLRFMQWKNPALHNFHSLDWGYDDYTVAQFTKDTGIQVPAGNDAGRAAARYRFLMSNAREQWIAWRCRRVAQLLTRIRDRVRKARPDLTVYVPVFPMTEAGSTYNRGTAWLREAGLDPKLISAIDGVALVNALHTYGRRADADTNALLRGNLTAPAQVHALAAPGQAARFLPTASYFEGTEAIVPAEKLGFPANTRKTWMSAVVNPAGRSYLERFAVLLAEADALMLGDGGNAYTLGQPELREFLAEYRRLPAVPFRPRADARDPVAIWEGESGGNYYFYAVNRTARPVIMRMSFSGSGALRRLADDAAAPLAGNGLEAQLAPFQLLAYRTSSSLRIAHASAR
ncbi:MAG TPA: family 10 glycosylhydrolase, partial [Burkholderiales bacterium]|nr:family 10 glycosylhydrolase [Burkholderiales bacterium]